MIQAPDYIRAIQPYVPGKPIEELERELGISHSIKLASNENPLGPSPAAQAAIRDAFGDLNRYPDGAGYYLKKELSGRLGVSEDELILGNGSNELLDIAARTFLKTGDEAVMGAPSFVVYSMAVQSVGGTSVQVPLRNHIHDLAAMAGAITPRTRMLFLANPNNPTGTYNTADEFDGLMKKVHEDMLLVVDEAYYEYVTAPDYADSMKHFRSGRNILILRTFSKIYGLAGLRIGYGIAKKEILADMNRLREPFNTSSLSQKAALAALGDKAHVARSREINSEGKQYLYRELETLGVSWVPTEANFIYIPMDDPMNVYNGLLKKGVIIRPMGPRAIRVTIGLPE
ncbi:MAG TPA: histidinol-phosphate transaminase, partial [Thermodesulfovibrionales bacterium]|nr:histidinol-phosphate transaminase [Thermodesulfovibrionales bacterium]